MFIGLVISDVAKYVNLQGKIKSSKKYAAEIKFDFQIASVGEIVYKTWIIFIEIAHVFFKLMDLLYVFFPVCLTDSVLAFHKHGIGIFESVYECSLTSENHMTFFQVCRDEVSETVKLHKK